MFTLATFFARTFIGEKLLQNSSDRPKLIVNDPKWEDPDLWHDEITCHN